MTKEIHYVYLLVDRTEFRFKIGVSINPIRRSQQLQQDFQLGMSLQAGFTQAKAYELERKLHLLNSHCQIPPEELRHAPGSTEWFHFGCFTLCRAILLNSNPLVPLSQIKPTPYKRKDFVEECAALLRDPVILGKILNSPKFQRLRNIH